MLKPLSGGIMAIEILFLPVGWRLLQKKEQNYCLSAWLSLYLFV